jgi:hypothetical protein
MRRGEKVKGEIEKMRRGEIEKMGKGEKVKR